MGSRLTWPQICESDEFRGCWVALDGCRYDPRTAQPTEGTVVDADEDLVALCSRMQASDSKYCAILFCEERVNEEEAGTTPRRPSGHAAAPSAPRLPLELIRPIAGGGRIGGTYRMPLDLATGWDEFSARATLAPD